MTISNTLYSENDIGSSFFTIIGVYPFFIFNVYASGFVLGYQKNNKDKAGFLRKILCTGIAIVYILFVGGSLLTEDGVGMLLPELERGQQVAIVAFGMAAFGFTTFTTGFSKGKKCKSSEKADSLFYVLICLVSGFIVMQILKRCFDRPRYRLTLENIPGIEYTAWYRRIHDIQSLIAENGIDTEEIRSFPSGHGYCSGATVGIFSSLFKNKKHGYICGIIYMCLVMASRIVLGAHFLSDVTFGAILSVAAYFVYLVIAQSHRTDPLV